MALSLTKDLTAEFNANSFVVLDVNGWDYVIFHLVTPSSSISFTGSNDGGAITGSVDDGPRSAANFLTLAAQNLAATASTTYITSLNASGLVRFDFPPAYIKLSGTEATMTKLIVKLHKIT